MIPMPGARYTRKFKFENHRPETPVEERTVLRQLLGVVQEDVEKSPVSWISTPHQAPKLVVPPFSDVPDSW